MLCVFVTRAVFVLSCVFCVCGSCVGGGRGGGRGVCCVFAGACVVRWLCVLLRAPTFPGSGLRLCVGVGVVCCGPSPVLAEGLAWVQVPATPDWGLLVVVVGGTSPLLAEGRGCGFPPILAGVHWLWSWVIPRHSSLRAFGAVPSHC